MNKPVKVVSNEQKMINDIVFLKKKIEKKIKKHKLKAILDKNEKEYIKELEEICSCLRKSIYK